MSLVRVQNQTFNYVYVIDGDLYTQEEAECTVVVEWISWFIFTCILQGVFYIRSKWIHPVPKLEEKWTFSTALSLTYIWFPLRVYDCSAVPGLINATHYSSSQAVLYDLQQGYAVLSALFFGAAYLLHIWSNAPTPRFRAITTTEPQCSICFEDYKTTPAVAPPNCEHAFHATCITEWFYIDPVCPICRKAM